MFKEFNAYNLALAIGERYTRNFQDKTKFFEKTTPWQCQMKILCSNTKANGRHLLKWRAEQKF